MVRKVSCCVAVILVLFAAESARAQARHEIHFPDVPGYQTLLCDFHSHTVFSDGEVWPTTRVREAWRLGLDLIAISDHVEYQPHKEDLPTQHHRPHEIATEPAREFDVLLPLSAEITRDTPPGHFNAIFLTEIKRLETEDFVEAIGRANEQGAFVFWNHHGWKGPELGRWMDVHTTLLEKGWLQGMEVCNGESYYPEAHAWCLEKNLTMLGNTDIHTPDLREKNTPDDHRTLTLVLAKERSLPSVKEALLQRRTAVWFEDKIIGGEELLGQLFGACVRSTRAPPAVAQCPLVQGGQPLRPGHPTGAYGGHWSRSHHPTGPHHEPGPDQRETTRPGTNAPLHGGQLPDRTRKESARSVGNPARRSSVKARP